MNTDGGPVQLEADTVLRGGLVVTMNESREILSPGAVALKGEQIVAVGPVDVIDTTVTAEGVINCSDHIVMPGLVNTHTHMPMSLLRGLADDLRLDVWLYGYILPVEKVFVNPEFCFLGASLSCAEMLRGGTTCFVDMYYHEEEVAWAAVQAGIRGVCGETIIKFPSPDAPSFDDSLRYCADFVEHWKGHELIVAAPAPHSVYMTTPEILEMTTELAARFDVPQIIHVSETADEVSAWVEQTSMPPARWLQENGYLESKVVAAHCVHVTAEEMQIMANQGVGVAHNPTSNLKLASGVAPVAEMLDRGVNVGLGTDGCASNNDLDMFEEMRLGALLPKGITGSPIAVPASEAVAMATIYGARAIHLDHLIGSIETGKRADLIVVNQERIHMLPHFETTGQNVYSRLAYTAKASDVRDVFVNGRLVVQDGRTLTVDESDLLRRAADVALRIDAFFVEREKSVLDKLVAIGGLEQEETFEVQAKAALTDRSFFDVGLSHAETYVTQRTVRDQYDTYFELADSEQGRLRYREDNVIQPDGSVSPVYFLALTGPAKEAEYENSVVLSRSRFSAPAGRSLRFYREYFQPTRIVQVSKHRERYHIRYKGVDFALNLDEVTNRKQEQLFV